MKLVRGAALLSFFSLLLGSCFDPPDFPATPEIVFDEIVFRDVPDNNKPDSLILYIDFKDGDGDLGLDPQDPFYYADPYNYGDFFQINKTGGFNTIQTLPGQLTTQVNNIPTTIIVDLLDIPNPADGKLVFPRTRNNPSYSTLPMFSCADYEPKDFVIEGVDADVLDQFSTIKDTVFDQGRPYLLVFDTLYFEPNPNHYNITVDFLVKTDPNNPVPDLRFTEFDWRKEFCTTFDGRFPVLSTSSSALDGNLKYAMESRGFKILFGGKTLKLRIQIKDRSLNESNTIETPEFTLDGIRK